MILDLDPSKSMKMELNLIVQTHIDTIRADLCYGGEFGEDAYIRGFWYHIDDLLDYAVQENNVQAVNKIMDCFYVPDNLTLQERIAYYKMFGEN